MKIDGELFEVRFIERLNRFEAIIEMNGVNHLAHVPNTGRLKELLAEGATVLIKKFNNPKRKTEYGLLLVKKNDIWVSIDSANVPNRIVYDALMQRKFAQFNEYSGIRREVTPPDCKGNSCSKGKIIKAVKRNSKDDSESRFDFGLYKDDFEYYIEVKGVTLVEDRQAYFPDAPTTRGTRHLEELTRLKKEGKGAGVIFIIQREDADVIKPNDRTDKAFGDALRNAQKAGVDLMAYVCAVDAERRQIEIIRQIPVLL